MKKIITLFFIGSLMTSTISTAIAQNGAATAYTVSNLTPDLNTIIENVKKECTLSPEQFEKFKNDYVLFLNLNTKPNANTQGLLFLLGQKIKPYLSEAQFTKVVKMGQEGKLTPKPATVPTVKTTKEDSKLAVASSATSKSNVTTLFEQLQSYMQITKEKSAQIIPILKDYDQQLTKIKSENAGNADKIKQQTDVLSNQIVPKLKLHMTDQQIGTLVLALTIQDNILSGKNLSADQKIFLDNVRNKYGLNDVQSMAVVLVMVEMKIRGDAIALLQKTNQQQAGQELIKLLQDVDGQLKTTLTNDQYTKVKTDIEKLIKGQKL